MKRHARTALVVTIPFLVFGTVFMTARYTALAAEARRLEAVQEEWADQNAKLVASIAVLSSRERIAAWAERLGLQKAGPERRLHVLPPKPRKAGDNG
jgi:cell division protein FtsL